MKTRNQLLEYAKSVHLALTGEPLPTECSESDHPYGGFNVDTIKEMVNTDLVKSQIRAFEKELRSEMEAMFANLEIGTPVKVTKGSKDKRGIEGFILHAKEPLQGSGKALFVYDVLTHKCCMVRDSATKVRVPKPGERSSLKETYRVCETLSPHFTRGQKVHLKSDPSQTGVLLEDATLNPNLEGHGFYQVSVCWDRSGLTTTHILTELELKN